MKLCKRKKAEKFADSVCYSKDGIVPVVVCDAADKELLMQAYANREAIAKTLTTGYAWFYSRSRKRLWKKGETSRNMMQVKAVGIDCDNDTVLYEVEVLGAGNTCHLSRKGCFVRRFGVKNERLTIAKLGGVIEERAKNPNKTSYTAKLLGNRKLACAKVSEEADELVEAIAKKAKKE
ncbi:MAG: phosphoribosyl-AMP cyclohydrolase, partial [Candidatus Anstonellaceae archaeon]